jgi:hypothetical protein
MLAPPVERGPETNEAMTYCVSITWVLERVFGNGTPRNDGLVDELVRKRTDLVSMVSVIWTPVPAARCAAQGVVVEPPAAVQAIATAIPPACGEDPHTTPACAIFPIYPVATVETGAYGDTSLP